MSLAIAQTALTGDRSLTNFELRPSSLEGMRIDMPVSDDEDTLSALRERQILSEATVRALTDSLVQSNLSAEISRRQAADLALKLETFGISNINKDPASNDQKLLVAVRSLRDLKKQCDDARLELMRLTEAILTLVKTADHVDPVARLAVETELRKTREILGDSGLGVPAQAISASLTDAMVVEVKDDLSLVIANIGNKQGVQLGMYFKVLRAQKELGTVRVVDVRDRICGAVIQNLSSIKKPIRQGDHLRVETQP